MPHRAEKDTVMRGMLLLWLMLSGPAAGGTTFFETGRAHDAQSNAVSLWLVVDESGPRGELWVKQADRSGEATFPLPLADLGSFARLLEGVLPEMTAGPARLRILPAPRGPRVLEASSGSQPHRILLEPPVVEELRHGLERLERQLKKLEP